MSCINRLVTGLVLAGCVHLVHASGFALIEQSASGMGNAFAGAAASSDDASYQYFNPASISFVGGTRVSGALHVISPDATLEGASARVVTLGNVPYSGGGSGDPGVTGFVPNFYYVRDIDPRLKFGLGVNAPFGLATEYDSGWIGRYHAVESDMQTVNINPVLSYKPNQRFSVAGGVSIQYVKVLLSNAIDSSSICLGLQASGTLPAGTCTAYGLATPGKASTDSFVENKGDGWGYGFNLGLMWTPVPSTTLGLAYRSEVEHSLSGKADFQRSSEFNNLLSAIGSTLLTDTKITSDTTMPATASFSVSHQMTPSVRLLADVTWTGWSSFEQLVIDFANPLQANGVTTESWENTMRYSVGANWQVRPDLKLRVGVAYDETPVPSAARRTPRIPDGNRTWLAIGAGYAHDRRLTLDLGYSHLFVADVAIDNTTENSVTHNLTGTYASSVDILSMQANWTF